VAAAREAAIYGIAAISVSLQGRRGAHFTQAAAFVRNLAAMVAENGLPRGTILNVNIPDLPADDMAGVRVTRQALAPAAERYEKRRDPRNRDYYWASAERQIFARGTDQDGSALAEGFISVTPIACDATDYGSIERLKTWDLDRHTPHPQAVPAWPVPVRT
jgi:5'-nucleotidase